MSLPFKCIDCGKGIRIMYGGICQQCKKNRDEEE